MNHYIFYKDMIQLLLHKFVMLQIYVIVSVT